MGKRYIVYNPKVVVDVGFRGIREKIEAGKIEVENDIASLIYYPCLAVVENHASYADISAAFNYKGIYTKDGLLTYRKERLMSFFTVMEEDEENVCLKFNPEACDNYFGVAERIVAYANAFDQIKK